MLRALNVSGDSSDTHHDHCLIIIMFHSGRGKKNPHKWLECTRQGQGMSLTDRALDLYSHLLPHLLNQTHFM